MGVVSRLRFMLKCYVVHTVHGLFHMSLTHWHKCYIRKKCINRIQHGKYISVDTNIFC